MAASKTNKLTLSAFNGWEVPPDLVPEAASECARKITARDGEEEAQML